MYLPTSEIDSASLWQGDILNDVALFGVVPIANCSIHSPIVTIPANQQAKTCSIPYQTGDVAVISHSCELDRANNGIKVTSIIVAPIRDLSRASPRDKIADIKASNIIVPGTQHSYLKYFVLDPTASISCGEDGGVIDFSKCFSFNKTSYDYLIARKKLQLTEQARSQMALKLALYFHRAQQPMETQPAP